MQPAQRDQQDTTIPAGDIPVDILVGRDDVVALRDLYDLAERPFSARHVTREQLTRARRAIGALDRATLAGGTARITREEARAS